MASNNPGGGFGSVGIPDPKPKPKAATASGKPEKRQMGSTATAPPSAAPVTTAPAPAPSAEPWTNLTSAEQVLQADLTQWGLGNLAGQLWNDHLNGANDAQLMINLRNSDTYKQRFSGLLQLQQKYGTSVDESTYMGMEDQVRQTLHAYGVDPSTVSQSFIGSILGNDVSNSELQQRLQNATTIINDPGMAPVRDYYQQHFGLGSKDLLNYWLDPEQNSQLLTQKVNAAQIGAAAQQAGFGTLDTTNALALAQQGVTAQQAASGFGKAASQQELTQHIGDGTTDVTNQDLIDATFNQNADAQRKIDKAAQTRTSRFISGGGFAANQQGVGGLGSATDSAL